MNVAFSARPDEENRNLGSESADYQATPDKRAVILKREHEKSRGADRPFCCFSEARGSATPPQRIDETRRVQ